MLLNILVRIRSYLYSCITIVEHHYASKCFPSIDFLMMKNIYAFYILFCIDKYDSEEMSFPNSNQDYYSYTLYVKRNTVIEKMIPNDLRVNYDFI